MSGSGSASPSRPGSDPLPRRWCIRVAGLALSLALSAAPALAQDPPRLPVLVVNQERLLTGSQRGQALLAAEEAMRDRLRTEARAIDSAFEEEERAITAARPGLEPEAFRALADAFDEKVVNARREQDARAAALAQEFDAGRRQFYAAIAPLLMQLMDRHGALTILDETTVLMAAQELNITDEAIAEIDATPVEEPALDLPAEAPEAPADDPDAPTAPQ